MENVCGKVFLKSFCFTVFAQFNHILNHYKVYPILPFTLGLLIYGLILGVGHLRRVYNEKHPQHAYLDQKYLYSLL